MDARTKTTVLCICWSALFSILATFLIVVKIYFWGIIVGLIALAVMSTALASINDKLNLPEEESEIEYTKGKKILLSTITITVVAVTVVATVFGTNYFFDPSSTYKSTNSIYDDEETVRCDSCHNYYRKNSQNAKSIIDTNMCTSCYENFRYVYDAYMEMPVN